MKTPASTCCLVFALSLLATDPTHAQVFHDDFDGTTLDATKWDVAGGGAVSLAGGFATLSAGCGEQFPYVTSKSNPFPATGDPYRRRRSTRGVRRSRSPALYVDGVLRGSGPSEYRPVGVFLGHPPYSYCPWTTSEVDFVHVEAIGATATRSQPWGRLKLVYR